MNDHTAQPGEYSHRVDRDGAPSFVEVVEGQQRGRRRMDPVQRRLDAQAGLVGVDDVCSGKGVA